MNHPNEKEINRKRKEIHNHYNTHHVEGFLECDKPELRHLVEMVCDNVATALARNAKYENIYEQNKLRYMKKGLPEILAIICTNTFIDLWDAVKNNNQE